MFKDKCIKKVVTGFLLLVGRKLMGRKVLPMIKNSIRGMARKNLF